MLCPVQELNGTVQKWLESLLQPPSSEESYPPSLFLIDAHHIHVRVHVCIMDYPPNLRLLIYELDYSQWGVSKLESLN